MLSIDSEYQPNYEPYLPVSRALRVIRISDRARRRTDFHNTKGILKRYRW